MNEILKQYDAIFVGNYTKDTIITPDGTRYVDGGGMNYAAHAAARLAGKRHITRLSARMSMCPAIRADGSIASRFTHLFHIDDPGVQDHD